MYLFYNYNDNNNYNFITFYYLKKSKYNVFTGLYKYFEITLLIFIFVKKCEVSPPTFLSPNLISVFENMMQFGPFTLNFLNQIKVF